MIADTITLFQKSMTARSAKTLAIDPHWADVFLRARRRQRGVVLDDPSGVHAAWQRVYRHHHPDRRLDLTHGQDGRWRLKLIEASAPRGQWARILAPLQTTGDSVKVVRRTAHATQVAVWRHTHRTPGFHATIEKVPGGLRITRVKKPVQTPTHRERMEAMKPGTSFRTRDGLLQTWRTVAGRLRRAHPASRWTVSRVLKADGSATGAMIVRRDAGRPPRAPKQA